MYTFTYKYMYKYMYVTCHKNCFSLTGTTPRRSDLLEKNRVVRQNPMERNFHIFYAMLAGITPAERQQLKLAEPTTYHYLNQSGCITDPTIDDERDFTRVCVLTQIIVDRRREGEGEREREREREMFAMELTLIDDPLPNRRLLTTITRFRMIIMHIRVYSPVDNII